MRSGSAFRMTQLHHQKEHFFPTSVMLPLDSLRWETTQDASLPPWDLTLDADPSSINAISGSSPSKLDSLNHNNSTTITSTHNQLLRGGVKSAEHPQTSQLTSPTALLQLSMSSNNNFLDSSSSSTTFSDADNQKLTSQYGATRFLLYPTHQNHPFLKSRKISSAQQQQYTTSHQANELISQQQSNLNSIAYNTQNSILQLRDRPSFSLSNRRTTVHDLRGISHQGSHTIMTQEVATDRANTANSNLLSSTNKRINLFGYLNMSLTNELNNSSHSTTSTNLHEPKKQTRRLHSASSTGRSQRDSSNQISARNSLQSTPITLASFVSESIPLATTITTNFNSNQATVTSTSRGLSLTKTNSPITTQTRIELTKQQQLFQSSLLSSDTCSQNGQTLQNLNGTLSQSASFHVSSNHWNKKKLSVVQKHSQKPNNHMNMYAGSGNVSGVTNGSNNSKSSRPLSSNPSISNNSSRRGSLTSRSSSGGSQSRKRKVEISETQKTKQQVNLQLNQEQNHEPLLEYTNKINNGNFSFVPLFSGQPKCNNKKQSTVTNLNMQNDTVHKPIKKVRVLETNKTLGIIQLFPQSSQTKSNSPNIHGNVQATQSNNQLIKSRAEKFGQPSFSQSLRTTTTNSPNARLPPETVADKVIPQRISTQESQQKYQKSSKVRSTPTPVILSLQPQCREFFQKN